MANAMEMSPQLALLEDQPPAGPDWIHEIKFDGYRTLASIEKKRVTLRTRNGLDWTDKYPSVAHVLEKAKLKNAILDGEVVALDGDGKTDFQILQNSLKTGQTKRLVYYVFDLLRFDGKDLTDLPLIERKAKLKKIVERIGDDAIRYSEHWQQNSRDLLKASCGLGLEGLISKKIDAPYTSGRNRNWIKSKCTKEQEFVIGGYVLSSSRYGFRSLLLGTYTKSGELQYVGRVGSGFTAASLDELTEKFRPLRQEESPFELNAPRPRDVVWLKPKLVAQIVFTEWTSDGSLRHPVFHGLRDDKSSRDVHPEGRASKPPRVTRKKLRAKPRRQPARSPS